jgi:DNA polymerase-1
VSRSRRKDQRAGADQDPHAAGRGRVSEKPRKLVLLDGHSLAFRAFFALPDTLVTSSGQVTNAVYGFTAMLLKLLGDERPDAVVACFDRGEPRFRIERFAEYKGNRPETPPSFRQQLPLIREVLDALRIPAVELEGYEADDLLATLARRGTEEGFEVVIVTGDRDCLQLVRDGVLVMMTRRGISDIGRYDAPAVFERYGVPPERWTDFAALKGEPSDNLPGVPGVGDKTAAQLVRKYGDVDAVIAHADELTPKLRENVCRHSAQVRLNKELGRLLDDVPLDIDPARLVLEPYDDRKVRALFSSLEFRTLYERLRELGLHPAAAATPLEIAPVSELAADEPVPVGEPMAIAWNERRMALAGVSGEVRTLPLAGAMRRLAPFLADPERGKVAHGAKPLFRAALADGIEVSGLRCDTEIGAYLLEPGAAGGYTLNDVAHRYLGISLAEEPAPSAEVHPVEDSGRLARDVIAVRGLAPLLEEHLRNRGMWELAEMLEFPLVGVLARMERAGILVDRRYLEELDESLRGKMVALEREVQSLAGEGFNVNSTPQLQRILFEKLGLPKTRRIKTGYSTDAAELAKLGGIHPIVDRLLEYREVAKLRTGFTDSLLALVDPGTGRIHTTYGQTSAATGRIASTAPNLQNVPIRGELGRRIRRAFIAPPGHCLLSADYSQIELRVLAHLSGDEGFLDAFAKQHDFHAAIAARVYGVSPADVTAEMRSRVKQFSYGIAYGMSSYGVSQRLGVPIDEAERFIEAYYAQFPNVKAFLEAQVERARIEGFTTTMFGRRRYLPELQSPNARIRALGERMALNAPIQGTAADITKKAMIDVDSALRREPVARMLLTVHDELVFEVRSDALERAAAIVRGCMEGAATLRCDLAVDVHAGASWADAHG